MQRQGSMEDYMSSKQVSTEMTNSGRLTSPLSSPGPSISTYQIPEEDDDSLVSHNGYPLEHVKAKYELQNPFQERVEKEYLVTEKGAGGGEENSPIPEVALTVPVKDDPNTLVSTLRMWVLGIITCAALSFVNQFFALRRNTVVIQALAAQLTALFAGQLWARAMPRWQIQLWPGTKYCIELNPGPFTIKEHALITVFANAASVYGNGVAYSTDIMTVLHTYYHKDLTFIQASLLVLTCQLIGFGAAGLLRKFLVEPAHMWWPATLVNVALLRTLHDRDLPKRGQLSRFQFFIIVSCISFVWYIVPGYFVPIVSVMAWMCWAWPKNVTVHQLASGYNGLGLFTFSLDWSTISSWNMSPLVNPWFVLVNIFAGFVVLTYIIIPSLYWSNVYDAKNFPILDTALYQPDGQNYPRRKLLTPQNELNITAYDNLGGPPRMSIFLLMAYGMGFATLTATIVHVILWHGKEIWERANLAAGEEKPDVHTKLMHRNYRRVPDWWFLVVMVVVMAAAIGLVEGWNNIFQIPWWGLLCSTGMAFFFTLPIGIITATTNQIPSINIVAEMIWGYYAPGKPIANMVFKNYAYVSTLQAIFFLTDMKVGHYLKIPPVTLFAVQLVGTIVAGLMNVSVISYLFKAVKDLCQEGNLIWQCPTAPLSFSASIIWGLVGPARIFGPDGPYWALNFFFLIGAIAPVPIYLLYKLFPKQQWLRKINMPVILGASSVLPPAGPVNFTTWFLIGMIFNYFILKYRRAWWQRYNYVLSAALDTGVAFMALLIFFTLTSHDKEVTWWGWGLNTIDACDYAKCPAAKGLIVELDSGLTCPPGAQL